MKNVKFIELIFENCEYSSRLSVGNDMYKDDIYYVNIDNIKTSIRTIGINAACKCEETDFVEIVLNQNANRMTAFFGDQLLFDRILQYNDITHINIIYADETVETVHVPWGDDKYENEYQTSFCDDEDGRLNIIIERQKYEPI